MVIDGGKGQLGVEVEVFSELGITDVGLVGMAKARAKALLRAFGSLRRLREANEVEISAVPGIPDEIARVVYEF